MNVRTEVLITRGLPTRLLPTREGRAKVAVLTQPSVLPTASQVVAALAEESLTVETIKLRDRDDAKTMSQAEEVYHRLAEFQLGRKDTIVGVGGGAATDLAGFVAATWLRGVESVYVPTTLLGAVDASIGGKTGLNLAGKNLVGSFWAPTRVVVDLPTMESLPSRLKSEGMAEAYKTGLIGDPKLAGLIEVDALHANLEEVIQRSVDVKLSIVADDPTECGERAVLNFGHTVGHAIEFASGLPHGLSVGLGLIAESAISEALLEFSGHGLVVDTVGRLGLPVVGPELDTEALWQLLHLDKKANADGLRMVLLEDVSMPVVRHVGGADVETGLRAIGLGSG